MLVAVGLRKIDNRNRFVENGYPLLEILFLLDLLQFLLIQKLQRQIRNHERGLTVRFGGVALHLQIMVAALGNGPPHDGVGGVFVAAADAHLAQFQRLLFQYRIKGPSVFDGKGFHVL